MINRLKYVNAFKHQIMCSLRQFVLFLLILYPRKLKVIHVLAYESFRFFCLLLRPGLPLPVHLDLLFHSLHHRYVHQSRKLIHRQLNQMSPKEQTILQWVNYKGFNKHRKKARI